MERGGGRGGGLDPLVTYIVICARVCLHCKTAIRMKSRPPSPSLHPSPSLPPALQGNRQEAASLDVDLTFPCLTHPDCV